MSEQVKPKKKIDFNPIEGQFDLTTDNNFSYESVPDNKKLQIPSNNQMILHGEFDLDGELQVEGSFIIED